MSTAFELGFRITADGRVAVVELDHIKRSLTDIAKLAGTAAQAVGAVMGDAGKVAQGTQAIQTAQQAVSELGQAQQDAKRWADALAVSFKAQNVALANTKSGLDAVMAAGRGVGSGPLNQLAQGSSAAAATLNQALGQIGQGAQQAGRQLTEGMGTATPTIRNTGHALDGLSDAMGRTRSEGETLARMMMGGLGLAAIVTLSHQAAAGFANLADQGTNLESRLRLVTRSSEQLAATQNTVFRIAQQARSPLEATTDIYFRFAKNADELKVSQQELAKITQVVSQTMLLSGSSTESAKAALMQFGQGLSANRVGGAELNSILEQLPPLAEAIAKGMGRTTSELKAMGERGELTARQVIEALLKSAPLIAAQFASITPTISSSIVQWDNALLRFTHSADRASGVSANLAGVISGLANHMDTVAATAMILAGAGLGRLSGALVQHTATTLQSALAVETKRRAVLAAAQADAEATAIELAAARAGMARAGVSMTVAAAEARLATATTANTAAQTALAAASGAATLGSRALAGAVGLLGGPIGMITMTLGVAGAAWLAFGEKGETALEKIAKKAEEAEGRLKRLKLEKTWGPGELGDARAQLDKAEQEMRVYASGPTSPSILAEKQKQIRILQDTVNELEQRDSKGRDPGSRYRQFMENDKFASKAEQTKKQLAEEARAFKEATAELDKNGKAYADALTKHQHNIAEIQRRGKESGSAHPNTQRRDLADLRARIDAERQLAAELAGTDAKQARVGEAQKTALKLRQELTAATSGQARSHLQAKLALADEWATLERDNEAKKQAVALADRQSKAVEQAATHLAKLKEAHAAQLDVLAAETDAASQSTEARKIAVELTRLEQEAKAKLLELDQQLPAAARAAAEADITAERDKQKALVRTAMGRQQAAQGAAELVQQNKRVAAESLLDERRRAAALLEIDAEVWRERIQLAADGTAERQQLEAAFQAWYGNQQAKPAMDAQRQVVDQFRGDFREGFRTMLTGTASDWRNWGKSLVNSFKTQVADQVYKAFAEPLVVQVVGNVSGLLGAGSGPAAQSGNAGFSGLANLASGAKSAYSLYTTGAAGLASQFAYSSLGQTLGLSGASVMGPATAAGQMGAGLTSTGSSLVSGAASAMSWMPWVAAALIGNSAMSKRGWSSAYNSNNNLLVDGSLAMRIGKRIGGPGLADLLGGGIHNRLFGWKKPHADAAGITGELSADGFSGDSWQDLSRQGGTFRKTKRWTERGAISSDLDNTLDAAMRASVAGIRSMGQTLGIETDAALQGFRHQFNLQLTDNGDWSKAGEKLQEEVSRASDALVTRLVPNLGAFTRQGESASQTYNRLATEITATDLILQAMGQNAQAAFGGAGLASIQARERLIDFAGGLEQFAAKSQSFYQHYYNDDERAKLQAVQAQQQVNEAFGQLGLAAPRTRAEFRALVEAQDKSSEAGARLFARLLDLEGAFYQATASAEAATEALAAAGRKSLDKLAAIAGQLEQVSTFRAGLNDSILGIRSQQPGFDAVGHWNKEVTGLRGQLGSAIGTDQQLAVADKLKAAMLNRYEAEQAALQRTRDAVLTAARAMNDGLLKLKDFAQGLTLSELTTASPEARFNEAQRQYQALLASAKGGNADAIAQLPGLAQTLLQLNRDYYAGNAAGSALADKVRIELAALGAQAKDAATLEAQWQAQELALSQKTVDELSRMQTIVDGWNTELRAKQSTLALEAVKSNAWLKDIAAHTEKMADLPAEVAAAVAAALRTIQLSLDAMTNTQSAASRQMLEQISQQTLATIRLERVARSGAL